MRKMISLGAVLLWATVILAAGAYQPLNVKTGLWQVTGATTAGGLTAIPPEMQAKMARLTPEQRAKTEAMLMSKFGGSTTPTNYKKCVTAKDLNTDPWGNGPDEHCTWTVLNSTGSDMEVRGSSCSAGRDEGMKTDLNVKLHVVNSENVSASMQGTSTGNGQTVNVSGTFTGKWIGASCP